MKTTIVMDASNRIVLSREVRRAAGIPRGQKLMVSATPGRIVLEMEANTSGRIIKRGKLKVWTGAVSVTPIEEAVDQSRHHSRCPSLILGWLSPLPPQLARNSDAVEQRRSPRRVAIDVTGSFPSATNASCDDIEGSR